MLFSRRKSRLVKMCLQWTVFLFLFALMFSFSYSTGSGRINLFKNWKNNRFYQTDTALIEYVKKNLIRPPLKSRFHFNPMNGMFFDDQFGMKKKLKLITGHLQIIEGFFVEVGANDGQFISQTLALERNFGWFGLLIEPNPEPFQLLSEMNRNAALVNAAICPTNYTDVIKLYVNPATRPSRGNHVGHNHDSYLATCVPLYTLLAAMNVSSVDYLSLDVGGIEFEVLRTIPFDKIAFKMITVENSDRNPKSWKTSLIYFMDQRGYIFLGTIKDYTMEEFVFVHASVYSESMVLKQKGIPQHDSFKPVKSEI